MKTLFDKIKPEILAEIEKERETLPNLVGELVDALKGEEYLSFLQLRHVISLKTYYSKAFKKELFTYWDLVTDESRVTNESQIEHHETIKQ